MIKTKQKIIDTAQELFYQNGMQQTTLQVIADEVGISVGNLAYHFKNKNEIVNQIAVYLKEDLLEVLSNYRNYPTFKDFHIQIERTFQVMLNYKFVFLNLGEMKAVYPEIDKVVEVFSLKLHTQIGNRLLYHIEKGNFISLSKREIGILQNSIKKLIFSFLLSNQTAPSVAIQAAIGEIWMLLKPLLNDQGKVSWDLIIAPMVVK